MPQEALAEYFLQIHKSKRWKLRFVLQCAPLLKGLQGSMIQTISKEECSYIIKDIRQTDIQTFCLFESDKNCVMFFYREKMLKEYLGKPEVKNFLKQYGYCEDCLSEILSLLKVRMTRYHKQKTEFPHELGCFLGYPIADVKGFIKHDGMNCILCRYWKVYSDVEKAEAIFYQFDQAKDIATDELLQGKQLYEIAS